MAKERSKKKKNNKKKTLTIAIIIVIGLVIGTYLFIDSKQLKVSTKKLVATLNSEVYDTDYIKKINNGEIISKKKKIDTSTIGKQKITIKVKNFFGKEEELNYEIDVIDDEAPVITFKASLSTPEGTQIDLLKDVSATDNSGEEIKVTVEGEYDFNKIGKYELVYVAADSTGNVAQETFTLEVTDKAKEPAPADTSSYFTTSKGFTGFVKDGITYVDGYLIANKTYALPSWYNPGGLTSDTLNAFYAMQAAAAVEGLNIYVASGLRTYNDQYIIYNNYVARDGQAEADTYSARPGHSEHQSGLAFDLNWIDNAFEYTAEGQWLNANAYKYGFILRYPKGKTDQTGYIYEPWHFRYVGTDLSYKLYNNGDWITMEDYFGITSQYNY